jgi:hypothetical protein
VVSGGADGLIKLWSLRAGAIAGRRNEMDKGTSQMLTPDQRFEARSKAAGTVQVYLIGGGRVLCVNTLGTGIVCYPVELIGRSASQDLANSDWLNAHLVRPLWLGDGGSLLGPNTSYQRRQTVQSPCGTPASDRLPLFTLRHHHAPCPISWLVRGQTPSW